MPGELGVLLSNRTGTWLRSRRLPPNALCNLDLFLKAVSSPEKLEYREVL